MSGKLLIFLLLSTTMLSRESGIAARDFKKGTSDPYSHLTRETRRDVKRLVKEQNQVLSSILAELRNENARQQKQERVLDAILTCFSCSHNARCVQQGGMMTCACDPGYLGDGTRCFLDEFTAHGFIGPMTPFRNSWYFASPTPASWNAARRICQGYGADLASCDDDDEWRHLYDAVARADPDRFHWLGARSEGAAGAWRWIRNGTEISRFHPSWRDGKPEFKGNTCLLMQDVETFKVQHSWRDYRCTAKFSFICEMELPDDNDAQ